MSYRLTIMGCGSSTGVPRVGGDWGQCDPKNPRNRRRRSSALIERRKAGGMTTVLVDTGPDLREPRAEAPSPRVEAARLDERDGGVHRLEHPHGLLTGPGQHRLPPALPDGLRERLPRLGVLRHDDDSERHAHTAPELKSRHRGLRVNPESLGYHPAP